MGDTKVALDTLSIKCTYLQLKESCLRGSKHRLLLLALADVSRCSPVSHRVLFLSFFHASKLLLFSRLLFVTFKIQRRLKLYSCYSSRASSRNAFLSLPYSYFFPHAWLWLL